MRENTKTCSTSKRSIAQLVAVALIVAGSCCLPRAAMATTDCPNLKITSIFVGTGVAYINYATGVGVIQQSDPNFKAIYALALTAQINKHPVMIRYNENNVNCANSYWSNINAIQML